MRFWWIKREFRGYITRSYYAEVYFKKSIRSQLRFEHFFSARPVFYREICLLYADEPRPHNLEQKDTCRQ